MLRNWLIYLLTLGAGVAFYLANGEWYAFYLLILLLVLPLFSFLCSLFFLLRTKITPTLPPELLQGQEGALVLEESGSCLPYRVRIGKSLLRPGVRESYPLYAEHCGRLTLAVRGCRVYDFLGLTGLKKRLPQSLTVTILPRPIPPKTLPDPGLFQAAAFRPRPGGLAEQQELREYRPGDPARQIHWKASLKSDKLMIREPQEPIERRFVLGLRSPESAAAFDRSFGELRWLSQWLVEQNVPHQVCYMGPRGLEIRAVSTAEDHRAMLLDVAEVVPGDAAPLPPGVSEGADWFCLLGKEAEDEA